MKKSDILRILNIDYEESEEEINRISFNSNDAREGDIFLALKGNLYNGNDYINIVKKNGCNFILSEEVSSENVYKIKNISKLKIKLTSLIYKDLIEKVSFIGVTGTNGKTTTTHIIYNCLKQEDIYEVILVGTNGIIYLDKTYEIDNTTPDEIIIFNFIKDNIKSNKKIYVIMEVSSHALSLNRIRNINFDIAVYLNLSHEHLDYYKDIENYALAKSKLFNKLRNNKIAIINIDDNYAYKMINLENNNIYFGKKCSQNKMKIVESNLNKLVFSYKKDIFEIPLIGEYNTYNTTAALIVLSKLNIDINTLKDRLKNMNQIPGRMELHRYNNKNIIIDFAHTPLAMKKVLTFIRTQTSNKIITLFGCGGNRDKDKRPKMMEVASLYSDEVYLTSDNPRFEDPLDIIKDTLMGMQNDHVHLFIDRRIAIYQAVKNLNKDEFLLILGKGHEKQQIVLDKKIKFNDLEEVERWI